MAISVIKFPPHLAQICLLFLARSLDGLLVQRSGRHFMGKAITHAFFSRLIPLARGMMNYIFRPCGKKSFWAEDESPGFAC
jgi:hypothetical protein